MFKYETQVSGNDRNMQRNNILFQLMATKIFALEILIDASTLKRIKCAIKIISNASEQTNEAFQNGLILLTFKNAIDNGAQHIQPRGGGKVRHREKGSWGVGAE